MWKKGDNESISLDSELEPKMAKAFLRTVIVAIVIVTAVIVWMYFDLFTKEDFTEVSKELIREVQLQKIEQYEAIENIDVN